MQTHARQAGLIATALLLLSALLVACGTPSVSTPTNNGGGINVFRTPNPNDASPTPTFPPFTVGAWPSNWSPANNEHMTIYVSCKSQPKSMNGPATPVVGASVDVYVGTPVNPTDVKAVTDSTGLAAAQFDLNDPQSGVPVTVEVTVALGGATYHAQTYFTPNPTQAPTATAGPSKTPTGTATP